MEYVLEVNGVKLNKTRSQLDWHLIRQQYSRKLSTPGIDMPDPIKKTRASSYGSSRRASQPRLSREKAHKIDEVTVKPYVAKYQSPNFPFNLHYTLSRLKTNTVRQQSFMEPQQGPYKSRVYKPKKCTPQRRFYMDCIKMDTDVQHTQHTEMQNLLKWLPEKRQASFYS